MGRAGRGSRHSDSGTDQGRVMSITYGGPAELRWLNDKKRWLVLRTFSVRWIPLPPFSSMGFDIPEGFQTDLASLPGFIRGFNPVNGHHLQPAIIHDYIYRNRAMGITKAEGDQMFYDGMIAMGTPSYRAWYMYQGVRLFGGSSYVARN